MTEDEIDAEADRIMKMSDAEIDAHIRAQGDDPDAVVRRFDIIVRNAITITKLRNAMKAASAELKCGAAEYVPAMPAAWEILDRALQETRI